MFLSLSALNEKIAIFWGHSKPWTLESMIPMRVSQNSKPSPVSRGESLVGKDRHWDLINREIWAVLG